MTQLAVKDEADVVSSTRMPAGDRPLVATGLWYLRCYCALDVAYSCVVLYRWLRIFVASTQPDVHLTIAIAAFQRVLQSISLALLALSPGGSRALIHKTQILLLTDALCLVSVLSLALCPLGLESGLKLISHLSIHNSLSFPVAGDASAMIRSWPLAIFRLTARTTALGMQPLWACMLDTAMWLLMVSLHANARDAAWLLGRSTLPGWIILLLAAVAGVVGAQRIQGPSISSRSPWLVDRDAARAVGNAPDPAFIHTSLQDTPTGLPLAPPGDQAGTSQQDTAQDASTSAAPLGAERHQDVVESAMAAHVQPRAAAADVSALPGPRALPTGGKYIPPSQVAVPSPAVIPISEVLQALRRVSAGQARAGGTRGPYRTSFRRAVISVKVTQPFGSELDCERVVRKVTQCALKDALAGRGWELGAITAVAFAGCLRLVMHAETVGGESADGDAAAEEAMFQEFRTLVNERLGLFEGLRVLQVGVVHQGRSSQTSVVPSPVALLMPSAGAGSWATQWDLSRLVLRLPAELVPPVVASSGGGDAAPEDPASLRIVVSLDGPPHPLLDQTWSPAQLQELPLDASGCRLLLVTGLAATPMDSVVAAIGRATPMAVVSVLKTHPKAVRSVGGSTGHSAGPGEGADEHVPDQLLSSIGVPLLPDIIACREVSGLFRSMVSDLGQDAAHAYSEHFTPFAWDLAEGLSPVAVADNFRCLGVQGCAEWLAQLLVFLVGNDLAHCAELVLAGLQGSAPPGVWDLLSSMLQQDNGNGSALNDVSSAVEGQEVDDRAHSPRQPQDKTGEHEIVAAAFGTPRSAQGGSLGSMQAVGHVGVVALSPSPSFECSTPRPSHPAGEQPADQNFLDGSARLRVAPSSWLYALQGAVLGWGMLPGEVPEAAGLEREYLELRGRSPSWVEAGCYSFEFVKSLLQAMRALISAWHWSSGGFTSIHLFNMMMWRLMSFTLAAFALSHAGGRCPAWMPAAMDSVLLLVLLVAGVSPSGLSGYLQAYGQLQLQPRWFRATLATYVTLRALLLRLPPRWLMITAVVQARALFVFLQMLGGMCTLRDSVVVWGIFSAGVTGAALMEAAARVRFLLDASRRAAEHSVRPRAYQQLADLKQESDEALSVSQVLANGGKEKEE